MSYRFDTEHESIFHCNTGGYKYTPPVLQTEAERASAVRYLSTDNQNGVGGFDVSAYVLANGKMINNELIPVEFRHHTIRCVLKEV